MNAATPRSRPTRRALGIRGVFLHGAAARRIFFAFMLAALVPLALLAALGWQSWSAQQAEQARLRQIERAKIIGLRLYDRLQAVHGALRAHASAAPWPAEGGAEVTGVLRGIRTWSPGDTVAGPGSERVARWQAARAAAAAGQGGGPQVPRLLWWFPSTAGNPADVLLAWPDPQGRGWWLGEPHPDLLWTDFADGALAAQACVRDLDGALLQCGVRRASGAGAGSDAGARWQLFLHGAFGSPSVEVHLAGPDDAQSGSAQAFGAVLLQAALATLLLIVMLSLMTVRRSLVPLQALAALTERLAARDWSARATVAGDDEFAELARAFNTMAERVGNQVRALGVQAEIDRSMIAAEEIEVPLRRVLARVHEQLPAARAALLAQPPGEPEAWVLSGRKGPVRTTVGRPSASDLDALPMPGPTRLRCDAGAPPWARALADDGQDCLWVWPLQWQAQTVALLALQGVDPAELEPEVAREIADLGQRVAVLLASSARQWQLTQRATRDALTGLLNRHGLEDAHGWLADKGAPMVLAFIDLDGFKEVNDSQGHALGDALLAQVAQRLAAALPRGAALGRVGGDEFVVLAGLGGDRAQQAATELAQQLLDALAAPFDCGGRPQVIGASVGLALTPEHGQRLDQLMRRADLAMYAAKAKGSRCWQLFRPLFEEQADERRWLARELRLALEQGQFELNYQPRLCLASGRITSVEALLRWRHPVRGMIPPGSFIGLAEEVGLIDPIGEWVLGCALGQQRAWIDQGLRPGAMAVNVSVRQLRDEGLPERVGQLLACHGLDASDLEIEVTESVSLSDVDPALGTLARMRALGVKVALDDFGTGYSSLARLHLLPVDVLKIDRAFVAELGERASADAVAQAIVALARALGKRVVAEGVESAQQLQRLRELGCDEVQGYLLAPPLEPDSLTRRLREACADGP